MQLFIICFGWFVVAMAGVGTTLLLSRAAAIAFDRVRRRFCRHAWRVDTNSVAGYRLQHCFRCGSGRVLDAWRENARLRAIGCDVAKELMRMQ